MLDDSPSVALLGSDRRQCTGPVLERGLTHPPVPNRGKVSLRLQLLHRLGRNSLRFLGLSRLSLRSTSLSCSRHDYLPTAIRAEATRSAARRSWSLRGVVGGRRGGGEDPWLCGPGFRRVCLYRGSAATVRGSTR